MKLSQIAEAIGARIENASPDAEISGVSGIDQAVTSQLTFVHNPKYAAAAKTTRATAVIVDEKFPAISTGAYRYPPGLAAEVAVTTARAADTDVTLIRFVAFDGAMLARYLELLG